MLRIAICTAALFGFGSFASAQDTRTTTSRPSGSSETPIPSAGVTLQTLESLPPQYRVWYGGVYRNRTTPQPSYAPVFNSYSFNSGQPYYSYGFRMRGTGGYYPQGVGGYYPANIGLWMWY
jgi:hypothetical protein